MRYYLQWGIAYVCATLSAATASLFGFMSSVGPYAFIKAGVLCVVAFVGCHGPAWASQLRNSYGIGVAFLAVLTTLLCVIVTLWGGLGTMASGGAEVRAERIKAAADASLDREALGRILSQRQRLPTTRPSSAVRPLLARAGDGTRLKANLETELATAIEAERLDGEAAALNERLRHAPPPIEADPEAAAFSQLTGLPLATSAALKALVVSLALEAGAMMAMLMAWAGTPPAAEPSRPAETPAAPRRRPLPEPSPARRPEPPQSATIIPIPKVFGSIKKFAAACISPAEGERLDIMALLTRYRSWCQEGGMPPADRDRFFDEIERIFAVDVDGSKVYCLNVRLAA